MKTLVIQSFRNANVPAWIARCLASVKPWAIAKGYDYRLTDDSVFELCGADYLAQVGGNLRSITNLCRLELIREAHAKGYDRAIWIDADIFIFDPANFRIDDAERFALAGETWIEPHSDNTKWLVVKSVNNSVIVCAKDQPDFDLLISTTRHVARHHKITSNFQLGGDIVKGMWRILKFPLLANVGMFSNFFVIALARENHKVIKIQAVQHGTPVYAANLCASENYVPAVPEPDTHRAMDLLEQSRGDLLNKHLGG